MEDPGHRPRTAEWIFREALFGQIKSQTRCLRQGESSVHHSHRRESQPLLPDFVRWAGLNLTADLLDDEVGHRRIDMQGGQASDRTFTCVRRHRDARYGCHLRYFPKSRDTTHVIDIGLEN